jgi:hypothetical protein
MTTDDYLQGVLVDRSLTNAEKNLIFTHIPRLLVATTTTAAAQTQLLADADKYTKGLKK